jgi:predicted membrane protein
MDTQVQNSGNQQPNNNGRIFAGLFLLVIGGLYFLKETNFFYFPDFIFTWPMILIVVGIYSGIKHNFRGPGWLILLIIGTVFLSDRMDIGIDLHRFLVPGIIIAVGIMLLARPRGSWSQGDWGGCGSRRYRRNRNFYQQTNYSTGPQNTGTPPNSSTQQNPGEDWVNANSVFGNFEKIVVSKNFKGGSINCFMGGAELDLSQADINGTVVLEISTVMGGAKLIVPPNWEIKSEVTTIMGGMEDKRQVRGALVDFNKTLVLKGTAFMGGIELRSY